MGKKEKDLDKVTLNSNDYIRAITADGKSVLVKKNELISSDDYSGKNSTLVAGTPSSQTLYASMKDLGQPGSRNIVLICKYDTATGEEDFKGIAGRLLVLRGGTSYAPHFSIHDVICTKSYKSFKCYLQSFGDTIPMSLGTCDYGSGQYLAIKINNVSARRLSFSGVYSSNCEFILVTENEITNWVERAV